MEPLMRPHSLGGPAPDVRGYEGIEDPAELRIAIRELCRVRTWIGQFADTMAELPGFGLEGVRATKATAAMVTLLIERAEAQLRRQTGGRMPMPDGRRVNTA